MSETIRVLVVEDEPIAQQAHASYLRRLDGFELAAVAGDAATDLGRPGTRRMRFKNGRPIDARHAAAINRLRLRPLDPFALALLDKSAFHLRDHTQHGQHHMPHIAARGDVRVEYGHKAYTRFARPAPIPPVIIQRSICSHVNRQTSLFVIVRVQECIRACAGCFGHCRPLPA